MNVGATVDHRNIPAAKWDGNHGISLSEQQDKLYHSSLCLARVHLPNNRRAINRLFPTLSNNTLCRLHSNRHRSVQWISSLIWGFLRRIELLRIWTLAALMSLDRKVSASCELCLSLSSYLIHTYPSRPRVLVIYRSQPVPWFDRPTYYLSRCLRQRESQIPYLAPLPLDGGYPEQQALRMFLFR